MCRLSSVFDRLFLISNEFEHEFESQTRGQALFFANCCESAPECADGAEQISIAQKLVFGFLSLPLEEGYPTHSPFTIEEANTSLS